MNMLPRFPVEVLEMICKYADRKTQKQVRLLSRACERLATPMVFTTVHLENSKTSSMNLRMICESQRLNTFVYELRYNLRHLPRLDHYEDWLDLSPSGFTINDLNPGTGIVDPNAPIEITTRLARDLTNFWVNFWELSNWQTNPCGGVCVDELVARMRLLPNLSALAFDSSGDTWQHISRPLRQVSEFERLSLMDPRLSFGETHDQIDYVRICTLIMAIELSKSSVRFLKVGPVTDVEVIDRGDPATFAARDCILYFIGRIKKVSLSFSSPEQVSDAVRYSEEMMGSRSNLAILEMTGDRIGDSRSQVNVSDLLLNTIRVSNCMTARLENLTLRRLAFHERAFKSCLSENAINLKRVTLSDLALEREDEEGHWAQIFTHMSKCLNLDSVHLSGSFVNSRSEAYKVTEEETINKLNCMKQRVIDHILRRGPSPFSEYTGRDRAILGSDRKPMYELPFRIEQDWSWMLAEKEMRRAYVSEEEWADMD